MEQLRIKVRLGDGQNPYHGKPLLRKFVYVIDTPSTTTIGELLRTLQEYIIKKLSYKHLQIVQLTTMDGFTLGESDLCSTVLKDNDQIICVDKKIFILTYFTFFDNTIVWLEQIQYDGSDKGEKIIRIGLNNISELFIRLISTKTIDSLYIFGMYQLMEIVKEKRENKLIGRLDNTMEYVPSAPWFLECQWEYDTDSDRSLFIVCHLKVASDDDVWSRKLQILLDRSRMCIEKAEMKDSSDEIIGNNILTAQQWQPLKELAATIPRPKRTGPQIDINVTSDLKIAKHECEGDSAILMAYGNKNTIAMEQIASNVEDMFIQQFFITPIAVFEKTTILSEILSQKRSQVVDKGISVTNLSLFYQMHDGGWRECQNLAIAPESAQGKDIRWLSHLLINIEPNKLLSYSIKGEILTRGTAGRCKEARTRTNTALPQPLRIKIVIEDNYGKQCSLIIEPLNKTLDLLTFEKFQTIRRDMKNLLAFIYVDDCKSDDRIYAYG
ncbi:unnamed protein product [Adineta ricciae]|uniref:Uncharacterized protein n=1 Tax=Adineta ricciae TaxID=249248 RepID=A0A816BJF2_ADIRI|nr:unnamed protein product [Adineta ricciae]CAF1610687.1 unnamed protein product [Adineta ricciae]